MSFTTRNWSTDAAGPPGSVDAVALNNLETRITNHDTDTTAVHGIADTSVLATTADLATVGSLARTTLFQFGEDPQTLTPALPVGAVVDEVLLEVTDAFVSAGSAAQRVQIGWAGADEAIVIAHADIDLAVAGVKAQTANTRGAQLRVRQTVARDLVVNYTTDGAAPTAGEMAIVVKYYVVAA